MRIDIGFGNAIQPPPIDARYPVLLDSPHPRIRVYPREAVVAEKLHAMVTHGELNSRYKDFYDLHALAQHFDFDGSTPRPRHQGDVRATGHIRLRGTDRSL